MEKNYEDGLREYLPVKVSEAKHKIAEVFGVNLYGDIAEPVLMKFYQSTLNDPYFRAFFKEKNGELTPFDEIIQ